MLIKMEKIIFVLVIKLLFFWRLKLVMKIFMVGRVLVLGMGIIMEMAMELMVIFMRILFR